MEITYKFRLYPNKEQESKLLQTLELCRQTYNYFLSQLNRKILSRFDLQAQLPKLKRERPELNNVYSKVLQMVLYQLYSNLKTLSQLKKKGKKVGKLRFKGKGWWKTFCYNQSGFKIIKTDKRLDKLYLSKIGFIPIRVHREIEGRIKQIIIKKYSSGKWFAIFQVEKPKANCMVKTERAVGIDVGVKYFLTDSDGRQVENPKFYEKSLERLRIAHRNLSRKKKSSANWKKARIKLARIYERLINQRDDFLHKLSRFYVNNYDIIAVEDLNIKGMVRNHKLTRKILDASWSKFFHMLSYKAANAGRIVVKVNPRGTSKECKFGNLDRDYNASLNILMRGWDSPEMPVEMEPLLVEIPASSIVEAGSPHPSEKGSPQ